MPHQGGTPHPLAPPGGTPNALPGQAAVHHVLPGQGANAQPLAGQANPMAGWVQGGAPGAQLLAPATALAGTAVTIGPRGSVGQPMNGPMTPMQAAAQPPQGAVAAPVAGSVVKSAAQVPLQPTPALANPRAQAQAAAAAQPAMGLVPPPAATLPNPASVRAGQGQPGPVVVQASSPARGVASGAQAVALAQAALAQTLGRVTAGQMTAGGAAMALAEAQLALRAGRLAMAQAQAQMGLPAAAQGQRGTPGAPVPLAQPSVAPRTAANAGAAALGTAPGRVGAQALPASAQAPRAGQLEPLANKGGAALRDGGQKQAELGAAAAMPKKLATALAMAPKLRKRGSHDRVEKVDSFTPRMQSPEMEDEDFWDAAGDEDDDWADDAPPQDEGAATSAAEAAAQHYRALQLWLQANDQQALLRELALGRRVLVLAPPDKTHLRLIGHVLWPGPADAVNAAGATGRAWPLAARWSATLPADLIWRQWRLRQWVDAEGGWHVAASQPDRHTPRLLLAGDALASTTPAVGEYIMVAEPRRLRRLMGQQWTLMALRVPVPLDGVGAQGAVVAGC